MSFFFISQLIRYARACSSYECFILRAARLSSKLPGRGYVRERLKSSLRKFYGRCGDLVKHYKVSLSQIYVTLHSGTWPYTVTPQFIRHNTNVWIYYRTGPFYRFWPYYQISGGLHGTLQRVRLANGGRLLLRTPGPVSSGTSICSNVETIFPELVMSTDLLSFEHPSVLLFYFKIGKFQLLIRTHLFLVDALYALIFFPQGYWIKWFFMFLLLFSFVAIILSIWCGFTSKGKSSLYLYMSLCCNHSWLAAFKTGGTDFSWPPGLAPLFQGPCTCMSNVVIRVRYVRKWRFIGSSVLL